MLPGGTQCGILPSEPCQGGSGSGGGSSGGSGGAGICYYCHGPGAANQTGPGNTSTGGTRQLPRHPCFQHPSLCWNLPAQLNEPTPQGPGNPRPWNRISGVCDAGLMLLPCRSLASSGDSGQQDNGEGGGQQPGRGGGSSGSAAIRGIWDLIFKLLGTADDPLAARAAQIQSSLTGRTAEKTVTAVLRATTPSGDSQIIVATSEDTFRAAWLRALKPGEIAVAGPDDAEINALNAARYMGLTSQEIAASRPICAGWQLTLRNAGVRMLSPLKQYSAYGWFP